MTAVTGHDERFSDDYATMLRAWRAGTLGRQQLDEWRRQRLSIVLRHVTTHSAFYRKHLSGVDINAITPQNLATLPFTTKADLRREQYDMLSGPISAARIFYETTGTTGPPTPCPRGARDIETSNSTVEEAWRRLFALHFPDRKPVVGLMGPSELYAFGDVFSAVCAELDVCHVKIWPESPRVGFGKALRLIEELGVDVIVCAPAVCLSLAKAAIHHGYDPRRLPVSMFLVLGEICTPEFAANAATVWPQATVCPTLYGSQESLCIATGAATQQLHLAELNYLYELVDPASGASLGAAGEGELVLTMLIDGIKPLIRYRTGDLVRIADTSGCDPLPGPVIDVLGRVDDRLDLGGVRVLPAQLESAVLDRITDCLGYQLIIDTTTSGRDRVTVRLELVGAAAADTAAAGSAVAARVRQLADVDVDVDVDELDPVTYAGSYVSWKAARIVDNRAGADSATRSAADVAHRYAVTT